ncbi:dTDP-4-dehydrorhamnose 3,5-epimerase [Winogradskyella sp. DF17]|uniref:dTDP-4-dehydrorhamnose 3,5-epimerase n=1 Tax=Winogradskyella pelagia TaxID=2819984 RepID=A0ABS3T011_9FLAO|nr:dTDP-4-dehydrorhamnose 3,5-epimerase [Winogradskyella sp. DF17]MBO3115774.1 dTDP-4-dehydrorhamnose 3,5-epimerase [Winogradskyella sp. DF17]
MKIIDMPLDGCFEIQPNLYSDERGYFMESYHQEKFNALIGADIQFVQDNESYSTKGVLRGLHFQEGKHAQAKLVRVIHGRILDVAVDIRANSSTYGHYFSTELSDTNRKQLFIPRGFAHGFVVLSETALFAYKCDNYYNKASEAGILYNDPDLNIDWVLQESDLKLSEKDLKLPRFKQIKHL